MEKVKYLCENVKKTPPNTKNNHCTKAYQDGENKVCLL